MCYFSEILGKPLEDARGIHVGVLVDLVATVNGINGRLTLTAIVVNVQEKTILIPYIKGTINSSPTIPIKLPNLTLDEYRQTPADIFLARDLLDKDLVSEDDTRLAQVSDLKFENLNGNQVVKAVDVSSLGFLRRCGLVKTAQSIASHKRFSLIEHLIPWTAIQIEPGASTLKMTVPMEPVAAKVNAALAKILPGLNRYQRKQFIENLDDNRLKDIFLQVEIEVQTSAALNLTDERLAKVIMEMGADEAVNLLARLSRPRQDSLLGLVDAEIARVLHRLLHYPHNTAGRIMTTGYHSIRLNQTAEQALSVLRQSPNGFEAGDSIYVTDANNRLTGTLCLTDLELASPAEPVTGLMSKHVVSVRLLERVEDVAPLIFKYALQAVPVVDENNVLRGVVLAKDALDQRAPATWKKRQPKKNVHPIIS